MNLRGDLIMTGYLNFLRSLTERQQKHEVQRLLLYQTDGHRGDKLPKDILMHPTVVGFAKSIRAEWRRADEDPKRENTFGKVGPLSFSDEQCTAPISLRYSSISCIFPVINLPLQLTVEALVYIDENGEAMLGNLQCSSNLSEVESQKAEFKALARQDYLAYLRKLTRIAQGNAIYELADKWVQERFNPVLLVTNSPLDAQLSAECANRRTALKDLFQRHVGLVNFEGDHCTVPIAFQFFGYPLTEEEQSAHLSDPENKDESGAPYLANYYVEVNILARVIARTPTEPDDLGGDLSIETASFLFVPMVNLATEKLTIIS